MPPPPPTHDSSPHLIRPAASRQGGTNVGEEEGGVQHSGPAQDGEGVPAYVGSGREGGGRGAQEGHAGCVQLVLYGEHAAEKVYAEGAGDEEVAEGGANHPQGPGGGGHHRTDSQEPEQSAEGGPRDTCPPEGKQHDVARGHDKQHCHALVGVARLVGPHGDAEDAENEEGQSVQRAAGAGAQAGNPRGKAAHETEGTDAFVL